MSNSLALPELQQDYHRLERGAIYWLVIPNSAHAQALTMQTLSQITAKRKAVLVAQESAVLGNTIDAQLQYNSFRNQSHIHPLS